MNPKKDKIMFNVWLNKSQSNQMQDAIADHDIEEALLLFRESFEQGMVEKR